MQQLIPLEMSVYQAVCLIGESVCDDFTEQRVKSTMFEQHQDRELKTAIFLGLCAACWPELEGRLSSLFDIHENQVSIQHVLDVIVPFESSKNACTVGNVEYAIANSCDARPVESTSASTRLESQSNTLYYMQ